MKKKWIGDFLVISLGCLMIGVAFNGFFDRYGMAPGGLSGLFVIINHILHIDLWISNLVFNIPLYIAAYKILSKEECLKPLWGILACSLLRQLPFCRDGIRSIIPGWPARLEEFFWEREPVLFFP